MLSLATRVVETVPSYTPVLTVATRVVETHCGNTALALNVLTCAHLCSPVLPVATQLSLCLCSPVLTCPHLVLPVATRLVETVPSYTPVLTVATRVVETYLAIQLSL